MRFGIALFFPYLEDFSQLGQGTDALMEALSRQNGELDLGDVEPASVLGCVMDFEFLGEPPSLGRRKRLIERSDRVCVQIVHHDDEFLRFAVGAVAKVADELGEVDLGPVLGVFDDSLALISTVFGLLAPMDSQRKRLDVWKSPFPPFPKLTLDLSIFRHDL